VAASTSKESLYIEYDPRVRVLARLVGALALSLLPASVAMAQQPPVITANPNPVQAGAAPGSTTISWDTGGADGVVMVSADGKPQDVFARGARGAMDAPWISAGSTYEFTLYTGANQSTRLASVVVKSEAARTPASKQAAWIRADPNPVPAGPEGKGTTIAWDTADGLPARVVVSVNGEQPRDFAGGASGSATADWIGMNQRYEFRLVRDNQQEPLATVVVTRPLDRASESTLFRVLAVAVLILLVAAVWRFVRDPEPPPLA
jgi:hypothetical protein